MKWYLNFGGGMSVVTFPRVIYIVSDSQEAAGGLGTHCKHPPPTPVGSWGKDQLSQHLE